MDIAVQTGDLEQEALSAQNQVKEVSTPLDLVVFCTADATDSDDSAFESDDDRGDDY